MPMAMKVAAKTIGQDMVSVSPIGGGLSGEEIKKIKSDVLVENRDRKIESIVNGEEYKEMKIEDHKDYKEGKGPSGHLFYMDFKYEDKNKKD